MSGDEIVHIIDAGIDLISRLCLSSHVTEINLRHNKIKNIDGLDKTIRLQYLDLSSNIIMGICGLKNLAELSILNLSSNYITEIDGLENLKCLTLLDLSFNCIVNLSGLKAFHNNSGHRLTILHLQGNQLSSLSSTISSLAGLQNLRQLTLFDPLSSVNNPICQKASQVPAYRAELFSKLTQLEILDGKDCHDRPLNLDFVVDVPEMPSLVELNSNSMYSEVDLVPEKLSSLISDTCHPSVATSSKFDLETSSSMTQAQSHSILGDLGRRSTDPGSGIAGPSSTEQRLMRLEKQLNSLVLASLPGPACTNSDEVTTLEKAQDPFTIMRPSTSDHHLCRERVTCQQATPHHPSLLTRPNSAIGGCGGGGGASKAPSSSRVSHLLYQTGGGGGNRLVYQNSINSPQIAGPYPTTKQPTAPCEELVSFNSSSSSATLSKQSSYSSQLPVPNSSKIPPSTSTIATMSSSSTLAVGGGNKTKVRRKQPLINRSSPPFTSGVCTNKSCFAAVIKSNEQQLPSGPETIDRGRRRENSSSRGGGTESEAYNKQTGDPATSSLEFSVDAVVNDPQLESMPAMTRALKKAFLAERQARLKLETQVAELESPNIYLQLSDVVQDYRHALSRIEELEKGLLYGKHDEKPTTESVLPQPPPFQDKSVAANCDEFAAPADCKENQVIVELKEKLNEESKRYKALEDEFRMALQLESERYAQVYSSMSSFQYKSNEAGAQVVELEKQLQEMKQKLSDVNAINLELKTKSNGQQKTLLLAQRNQKERICNLEDQLDQARLRIEDTERLKRELKMAKAELAAKDGLVEGLRAERRNWSEELANQGSAIAQDRGRLEAKVESLQGQVASLNESLERESEMGRSKQKQIEDQNTMLQELKTTNGELKSEMSRGEEESKKNIEQLEMRLSDLKKEHTDLTTNYRQVSQRKQELKEHSLELKRQLEDANRKNESINRRWYERATMLDNIEKQFDQMQVKWREQQLELERERDQAKELVGSLQDQLDKRDLEFRAQLDQLTSDKVTALNELDQVRVECQRRVTDVEQEMRSVLLEADQAKQAAEARLRCITEALTSPLPSDKASPLMSTHQQPMASKPPPAVVNDQNNNSSMTATNDVRSFTIDHLLAAALNGRRRY